MEERKKENLFFEFLEKQMKSFSDYNIQIPSLETGNIYTTCPNCSHTRKKKNAKCLRVDNVVGSWFCYHCGWRGDLKRGILGKGDPYEYRRYEPVKPKLDQSEPLGEKELKWFEQRGICAEVLEANNIQKAKIWMPQIEDWVNCIAFPYYRNSELVNVKYRDANKNMRQVPGAERTVYKYDSIKDWKEIIITEGEIDALSFETVGLENACSVPNGAKDLGFLKSVEHLFNEAERIILAVDNDSNGEYLKSELARRIGKEKCYQITYPEGCKDANDVLAKYGEEDLVECYKKVTPYPVEGIFEVLGFKGDIINYYEKGYDKGLNTGWNSLDEYYSVKQSHVTLVTGIPGHGKSEFIDALMMNLALNYDWHFGIFSPENYPPEVHFAKLAEKLIKKPFHKGPVERINESELNESIFWIQEHVRFLLPHENLSLDNILSLAKACVFRDGAKGVILDPWNEIDHARPQGLTETEYISQSLTKIRQFARINDVHFWLVVHPTKLQKENDNYPVPTPYDISGSAHWRNKADNCLAVWRDLGKNDGEVQIHIQKIRFKHIGKIGAVDLYWDKATGCFMERN
jgi:twinkle protein